MDGTAHLRMDSGAAIPLAGSAASALVGQWRRYDAATSAAAPPEIGL